MHYLERISISVAYSDQSKTKKYDRVGDYAALGDGALATESVSQQSILLGSQS